MKVGTRRLELLASIVIVGSFLSGRSFNPVSI
jgi:hypothetical protein